MQARHGISDTSARDPRIMLYSHDTFGLGHLRRSRALAAAITDADPRASALILTGSPVAGRFTFPRRVDHVRLPGVTKLRDGSYAARGMGMGIDEVTELRSGLIRTSARQYAPDILIVDKEPTGFRGELLPTLDMLQAEGRTKLVLGLRDVLDEPDVLAAEWDRKGAIAATERFYHEIWVYGVSSIYDPTEGLALSPETRARMQWTGYLRRALGSEDAPPEQPYVLITPGGGGDGQALVDLVLRAYETDPTLEPRAVLVYGPFLSGDTRAEFETRVAALQGRVTAVGFESQIETLFAGAQGVVCMGGYNTFCEVLSFDKRAVIVPRTVPRLEQWLRASRAEDLGLVRMLEESRDGLTPQTMIRAIRELPAQPLPSQMNADGLLDGLDHVTRRVAALLRTPSEQAAE
ncbi:Predicted glycosyl transferase [Cribrihabitans marinus]|uniref:Predicted glycosyl transferase n=1 Tax=Cribrihabitans marinus TaxID=1227549 RepID=A0A1H6SG60_9RHOB|nr:glycosyltransferase [Cribrihabitans marinus]GGH23707.1 membrane protein [Cribrihabitans marinus]SEI64894.1 Predicted glycosyl transferase [Cribrihabitans marinus]